MIKQGVNMTQITQTESKLKAPEFDLVTPEKTQHMVEISPEKSVEVVNQVDAFVAKLATEDINSDGFKSRLDSAFKLGREEVSLVSSLLTGGFMNQNSVGIEDSKAYGAMKDIRDQLDSLNPGKQGDLLSQNKLFGLIPYGNKLKSYFRKYQTAGAQLQVSLAQVNAACDDMKKDEIKIETTKKKLFDGMLKLKSAIVFAETLNEKVGELVAKEESTNPNRARVLRSDVLFYTSQNLTDMNMQMAVSVNGYLALDVLKKTAREMQNGCMRVATTGLSALAVAQTVARATGNQVEVMNMLKGASKTIEDLVIGTSVQLGNHVQETAKFAENPLIGVEAMKTAFDKTFEAMDAMDGFRAKAIENMSKTNLLLKAEIARSEVRVENMKLTNEKKVDLIEGPVKL